MPFRSSLTYSCEALRLAKDSYVAAESSIFPPDVHGATVAQEKAQDRNWRAPVLAPPVLGTLSRRILVRKAHLAGERTNCAPGRCDAGHGVRLNRLRREKPLALTSFGMLRFLFIQAGLIAWRRMIDPMLPQLPGVFLVQVLLAPPLSKDHLVAVSDAAGRQ